jgi:hypothetical protein
LWRPSPRYRGGSGSDGWPGDGRQHGELARRRAGLEGVEPEGSQRKDVVEEGGAGGRTRREDEDVRRGSHARPIARLVA